MDICRTRRRFNLDLFSTWLTVSDVVGNRIVKQHCVLRDNTNRLPERGLRDLTDILTINQDCTTIDIIKSE